jgi:hypothetical protein
MVILDVPIAPGDRRYAVRPSSPGRVRRRQPPQPVQETPDLIGWGGQLIFVVGYTSGGAPYGPSEEEVEMLLGPADVELRTSGESCGDSRHSLQSSRAREDGEQYEAHRARA